MLNEGRKKWNIFYLYNNNTNTVPKEEDWNSFFTLASKSGLFQGGSAIGKSIQLGSKEVADTTKSGGTLELYELPKT